MEYKTFPIFPELKADTDDDRTIPALFSVYGIIDAHGDRIHPGAFAESIKQDFSRIRILWQHDFYEPPIGIPVEIKELNQDELPEKIRSRYPQATGGLFGKVWFLNTPRGNEVLTGINAGAINQNSIGFEIEDLGFSNEDEPTSRTIREIKMGSLWDLSPVNWGANEASQIIKSSHLFASIKAADTQTIQAFQKELQDVIEQRKQMNARGNRSVWIFNQLELLKREV